MSAINRMREKPWLSGQKPAHLRPEYREPSGLIALPRERVGLMVFLVVAASLFGLFSVGYQLRADYQDWRPIAEPWQLWLNTAILLLASIALQLASRAASQGDIAKSQPVLLVAGLFTLAFLVGQLWVWSVLMSSGHYVASNPASSSFYLITGVHGAHMLGGLVAWLNTYRRMAGRANNGMSPERLALSIRLCATYWHFLFIVWLFLFYMLLVS